MITLIAFYTFALVLVFSAFRVVTARNPVHAVLFLILAFFNATGLFVLLGAEFIAMILAIVYVGAVAVLFLFVVMMLDIDFATLRDRVKSYSSIGALVGALFFVEVFLLIKVWAGSPNRLSNIENPIVQGAGNTQALGKIIYTDYALLFQLSGLVLLLAMIGAIVLTHRTRSGVRRQKISDQVSRKREDAIEIVSGKKGSKK